MGVMFGILGLILMVYRMARNLAPLYSAEGALFWALVAWGVGLAFVVGERYEPSRGA